MKTKEELIFQALGAASMCWTGTPSGVFDSTRCKQIGEELIAALDNVDALKPSHNNAMLEIALCVLELGYCIQSGEWQHRVGAINQRLHAVIAQLQQ